MNNPAQMSGERMINSNYCTDFPDLDSYVASGLITDEATTMGKKNTTGDLDVERLYTNF
jgi:hypothetical protein